jgi:hypothetical protein
MFVLIKCNFLPFCISRIRQKAKIGPTNFPVGEFFKFQLSNVYFWKKIYVISLNRLFSIRWTWLVYTTFIKNVHTKCRAKFVCEKRASTEMDVIQKVRENLSNHKMLLKDESPKFSTNINLYQNVEEVLRFLTSNMIKIVISWWYRLHFDLKSIQEYV